MQGPTQTAKRRPKLGDGAHFLRSLVATPRLTGAVAPSGRALARAMAAAVDPTSAGLVVELGPGTGPVTRALIERGLDRRRLVLVEYDLRFCRILESRFEGVRIIQGDAYDLPHTLAELGDTVDRGRRLQPAAPQPAAASARKADRRRLRADGAGRRLRPVHLRPPLADPARGLRRPLFGASRSGDLAQSAPARVWTYRLDGYAPARTGR